MASSLYDISVTSFLQILDALGTVLDKGAAHCADNGIDPDSLLAQERELIAIEALVRQGEVRAADARARRFRARHPTSPPWPHGTSPSTGTRAWYDPRSPRCARFRATARSSNRCVTS